MAKAIKRAKRKKPEYGSDVIVDLMKAFDIEYAAFNPGATFRGIHDSILNYGGNNRPEVIFCCHEEYSVAIAHGYAKAKGKPMVAITHNIVGLQHASMAIFNAWCDRVPLIVLGGTGPMDTTRRRPWIDWIHTALVQGNQVRDYVKWDDQPFSLNSVPESFIRGYRIATTEPKAPVYICYDADLQEDRINQPIKIPDVNRFAPPAPLQANPQALKHAARLLVEAKSPLVIADYLGRNPAAVAPLVKLAELLAIPVVDKFFRFNFPNNHPLDVTDGGNEFLEKADVILALDVPDLYGSLVKMNRTTRVSEYVTKPSLKIIHISMNDMLVRSWVHDYHALQPVDVPISADTSVAVPELLSICRKLSRKNETHKKTVKARFKKIKIHHDKFRKRRAAEAGLQSKSKVISTAFLAHELWEVIKDEDWVLVNCSPFFTRWARRFWNWTQPYQYLGRNSGAGVGYGLGAAIGGALAYKGSDKICVDIQADGDLLMTASALYTAAHHKIPLLIIMHNNQSFYNSEEHCKNIAKFRKRPVTLAGIGTRVDTPPVNFKMVAEGFGIYADGPIMRSDDLRPALQRALAVVKKKKIPALVDVISAPR
jgi:thiamine pyrophosphate-dependent acetolactate synthase large subunit-like protein